MSRQDEIRAFVDMTVTDAVDECADYLATATDAGLSAEDALALALFKFIAVWVDDVSVANQAEAAFREKIAIHRAELVAA